MIPSMEDWDEYAADAAQNDEAEREQHGDGFTSWAGDE